MSDHPLSTLPRRLWAGELSLHDAFWHYAVWYGLAVNVLTSVAYLILYVKDASPWLQVSIYFLPLPYNLLVLVAVWRSAARYDGDPKWADWARAIVSVWVVLMIAT